MMHMSADATQVKKVLFCSGKVYFDLAERQQKDKAERYCNYSSGTIYPLPLNNWTNL